MRSVARLTSLSTSVSITCPGLAGARAAVPRRGAAERTAPRRRPHERQHEHRQPAEEEPARPPRPGSAMSERQLPRRDRER